jgi:hypothetical protein
MPFFRRQKECLPGEGNGIIATLFWSTFPHQDGVAL